MEIVTYKYLPFSDGSLKVLSEGTMKFTKPSDFNDPFDCAPDYDPNNIKEFLESRPDLVQEAANDIGLSPNQIEQEKPAMISRLQAEVKTGKFGQPFSDRVGICSLTRDPLSLLMWAHYAGNHTGFVIEFNIQPDFDPNHCQDIQFAEWLIPHKVDYKSDKPVVSLLDDNMTKKDKQFLVKGMGWQYEQEERVIDHVRGSGIHKYNQTQILYSVIAGMRVKDSDYRLLEDTIAKVNRENGIDVKLYKASPAEGRYGLFVPNHPGLMSPHGSEFT